METVPTLGRVEIPSKIIKFNLMYPYELSQLRDRLRVINIDKKRKRTELIAISSRLNDRYWELANPQIENAFTIDKPKGQVFVKILGFDDGIWICGYEIFLADRGVGIGCHAYNLQYASRDKAIRAGVGEALHYLLTQEKRNDVKDSQKRILQHLIHECRKYLNPLPQQKVLF